MKQDLNANNFYPYDFYLNLNTLANRTSGSYDFTLKLSVFYQKLILIIKSEQFATKDNLIDDMCWNNSNKKKRNFITICSSQPAL